MKNSLTETLAEAVMCAVEDVVIGEPMSPMLLNRARTAATAVLHRRGIAGGRVSVRKQGTGLLVELCLPDGPTRVKRLVLTAT